MLRFGLLLVVESRHAGVSYCVMGRFLCSRLACYLSLRVSFPIAFPYLASTMPHLCVFFLILLQTNIHVLLLPLIFLPFLLLLSLLHLAILPFFYFVLLASLYFACLLLLLLL